MRFLAIVFVLLAGCDRVFGLDTVRADATATVDGTAGSPDATVGTCGSPEPRQQVVATSAANTTVVHTTSTQVGNTLVLVAAIASKTSVIASVTDDAGNQWRRGAGIASVGASLVSVELWYATSAKSVTVITATSNGAAISTAINLTEWPCALIGLDSNASTSSGASPSAPATTGMLTTTHPALVLGAVVFPSGTTSPARTTSGYTDLTMFFADQVYGAGAWSWQPPGAYNVSWDIEGTSDWVGSIIALTVP